MDFTNYDLLLLNSRKRQLAELSRFSENKRSCVGANPTNVNASVQATGDQILDGANNSASAYSMITGSLVRARDEQLFPQLRGRSATPITHKLPVQQRTVPSPYEAQLREKIRLADTADLVALLQRQYDSTVSLNRNAIAQQLTSQASPMSRFGSDLTSSLFSAPSSATALLSALHDSNPRSTDRTVHTNFNLRSGVPFSTNTLSTPFQNVSRNANQGYREKATDSYAPNHTQNCKVASVPLQKESSSVVLAVDEDHNWLSEFQVSASFPWECFIRDTVVHEYFFCFVTATHSFTVFAHFSALTTTTQCFLRSEFIEMTTAPRQALNSAGTSEIYQQVGIRCRFCAHKPPGEKASRASAFPSSLSQLYQSFTMMQREHFHKCSSIPSEKKDRLEALKSINMQGACDSKQYWIYAAQKLGMIDTCRGIEMTEESKSKGRLMPNYMAALDPPGTLSVATNKRVLGETGEFLVRPTDKLNLHPFLYSLLSQLQVVSLQPAERTGKRRSLPAGLKGFGCCYCCEAGRYGFSRTYPLRRRTLPQKLNDMFYHLQRCTLCPRNMKLEMRRHCQDDQTAEQNFDLFERIWKEQLGRNGDITT